MSADVAEAALRWQAPHDTAMALQAYGTSALASLPLEPRLKLTLEAQLQSVALCGDCFEVAGPSNASVALYDYGANSTSTFQLQLEWDPAYLGPLTVDLLPPVR